MKVLVFVPYPRDVAPGQRFRIEQWMPVLEAQGIEFGFSSFLSPELNAILYAPDRVLGKMGGLLKAYGNRVGEVLSLKGYDAVFMSREAALIGPALIERLLVRRKIPLVYDFDDAIFHRYVSPSNKYLSFLKFPGKTASICRLASHVIVGNGYLRQYALQFNDRVTVVPTTIDTSLYVPSPRTKAPEDPLLIGWTGSYSTVQYLSAIAPVLRRLRERCNFRFRVIGVPEYAMEGIDVESLPWRSGTEVQDIQPIDIGIMPLPEERWAKGKCALKALQFMALGIPTVISPVGVNREIIRDGENGYLAGDDDEWVERLSRLVESETLRRRIGQAGRATVESGFSAAVQAPRVAEVFRQVIRQR